MAYPMHRTTAQRRAGQPRPARGRAGGAGLLGRRQDLRGVASSSAPPARTAPTSTSSTTARRSPTACRTTATCSPATSRTSCRATRPCAGAGSSAGSAGTATACRPRSRRRSSSASPPRPRSSSSASTSSTTACRSSVLRYTSEWERYVTRQARWVDFANDYKTLDLDYMESVMWAFKTLHDKGLIYEGFRVLAYCWRCETPLSNTETADGRRLPRPAGPGADRLVRAGRSTAAPAERDGPLRILAWTTTPWTLPSNLALAVGPDIDYVVLEHGRAPVRARRGRALAGYEKELATRTESATVHGRDLVGRRYTPLFDFLVEQAGAQRLPGAGRRLRHHRGRHRRRAHGARLRRGRPERLHTRRASRPW